MDTLLLPGQNPRAWAETMINLEARKLVNTANTVAAMHLQDGFIRIQFVDEIRAFIMARALSFHPSSLPFPAGSSDSINWIMKVGLP